MTIGKIEITDRARSFAGPAADTLAAQMLDDWWVGDHDLEMTNEDIKNLIFHTMKIGDHEYILFGGDRPRIDICTRTETDPLDAGPFKGKRLMMPDME